MQLIIPLGFIVAGLLAGLIREKVLLEKLNTFVANKQIPGPEIIVL
jgi:hypothetical protein